jgi:hypothetical protein
MDSGSSGPTTQTVEQKTIPDWLKQPMLESFGKLEALTQQPYQPYTGERIAQFSPLQQQAFQAAGQQTVAPQIGQASGVAGLAALGGLGTEFSPYQTGQFGSQMGAYMSPYMQGVVDIQQREAERQAQIAGTERGAQAVRAGAFGGSRQAIMDAEAARNLALQKGDIQARGLQSAYDQAAKMFSDEQQRLEQSRQFGAGLGLQGLQTALQGAGVLGTLGGQQFGQQMDITTQQQQLGAQQRQAMQDILSQRYADFQAQQQYPYQQQALLLDAIRGTAPLTSSVTQSVYGAPTSPLQTVAGLGTLAYGLSKAEGGEITGYAEGGITGLLGDEQLAERAQAPTISTLARLAAEKEMMDRQQLRQAAARQVQPPQEERTVADEVMAGLMALDVPEEMFADGGVVAFQDGGYVPWMYRETRSPYENSGGLLDAVKSLFSGDTLESLLAARQRYVAAGSDTSGIDAAIKAEQAKRGVSPAEDARLARGPAMSGITTALPPEAQPEVDAEMAKLQRGPSVAGITDAASVPKATAAPVAASGAPRTAGIAGLAPAAQAMSDRELLNRGVAEERKKVEEGTAAAQKAEQDAARAAREDFEAEVAARKPLGGEREARAKEELGALGGKEKEAERSAWIEAGFAILSGESPNAIANIGKGAMQGRVAYTKQMEKIAERRDALNDTLDKIADLRRQEDMATGKERRELKSQERKLEAAALRETATLAKDLGYTATREDNKTLYETQVKERLAKQAQASAERVAGIYTSGRGASGTAALAGTKEARLRISAQLASVDRQLGQYKNVFRPEDKAKKAELQAEQARLRSQLAALGPEGAETPASAVNSQSTTRIKFDAQGNMIQ